MAENYWVELWPGWTRRWDGMVLRILFGATGSMIGFGLIALANFGATFKKDQPEWDGEAISILILGIATIAVSLAVMFRPSRLSILSTVIVVIAIPVVGSIV